MVVVVSLFIGKVKKASMGEATCKFFYVKKVREGSIPGKGGTQCKKSHPKMSL